ncbi:GNAT family N-acetyltransferase [Desemzia sp. RIT804]|uniref:GNAT family N-acetyltransferase n=1 Tax=Desemzia sp. RIT 804 TaxID=2810209 RepID=UPI00194F74D6|nr:GNAT family N-acetyltransferase [Desemzia sp. RIT 804]MBM6614921.1 GNAT family N-acetyltransferase [Desemzia sp. RIT 804]
MEVSIRNIEKKDYPDILDLWNTEIGNTMVNSNNIEGYYEEMAVDKRYQTFVAIYGNRVVGFITSVNSLAVGLENGFVHITGLAVKEKFQGQGIGKKLFLYLEEYANKIGVHSLILNSGIQRKKAHKFYEKNGYSKDSFCFDKII